MFDGMCNLCTGAVRFIIKRDSAAKFRFAAMQSETGMKLIRKHGLAHLSTSTLCLLTESGSLLTQSDAVLAIVRYLDGFWPMFYVARVIPRPLRNWGYAQVARRRYKLFGRRDTCLLPTPEINRRFLE